jgi:hypothetical protein
MSLSLGLVLSEDMSKTVDAAVDAGYIHGDHLRLLDEIYPVFNSVFVSIAHV